MSANAAATADLRAAFIRASVWHGSLAEAEALLAGHPGLAGRDIHTAAILGDEHKVRQFLAMDPACVRSTSEPFGAEPLVHLCLSKYLRLDTTRSAGFIQAATALLDAGANPNSGFWTTGPHPEFETALYGAAGVAHHAGLTRLLLEHGADPNDGEVAYHSPETDDNETLRVLIDSGRLSEDSLATMLLRKSDWHDYDGVKLLLEHGADPNRMTPWHRTALHQAIRRDNALAIVQLLLDHGADPRLKAGANDGRSASAVAIATKRGRGDVLEWLETRTGSLALQGLDALLAACATGDTPELRLFAAHEPLVVAELLAEGGDRLAEFAANGNTRGVTCLLDLGVDVNAIYAQGDAYFGIARNSTALHAAAWLARHETVILLIARGVDVNARDADGRTALMLAVRACVDSYWTRRRTAESVRALLAAGASKEGVMYPSGYADVDALLAPT